MLDSLIKFFSSLKNRSRARRSPFVIAIVALLVIIPTVFAIFYGYFYDDTGFIDSNDVKIELFDKSGRLLYSEEINKSGISSSKDAQILYSMHTEKVESEQSVPTDKTPSFKLSVTYEKKTSSYECYFTDLYESSFIVDRDKKVYSLPEEAYESFLLCSFSESAYASATPPALLTGNGEEVYPISAEWKYRRADDKLINAKGVFTSSDSATYKIGGAIKLSFEKNPDECKVKIYDTNKNVIYDGSIDELPFLTVEKGSILAAHIDAEWKESEALDFCGKLSYDFKINVGDRSEFSINTTEVRPGEFIVISVTNVDDISKIIFSSKAKRDVEYPNDNERAFAELYQFVPTFVRDGEYARAIFPFPYGLPEYTFDFALSYGAAEERFSISILASPEPDTTVLQTTADKLNAASSNVAKKEFSNLMDSITATSNDLTPWTDSFASPTDYGFSEGYSFADMLTIQSNDASIIANGNEYLNDNGAVRALSIGRVIKVGSCDTLGNYVIIDHGMGLRTWYCYLSDVDAIEGTLVAKGDTIGTSGSNALLSSNGTLILCSAHNTLIDPNYIIGRKIEP